MNLPRPARVGVFFMVYMATVVSLFAGCGGLDLGFKLEGYDILWANEWDVSAADTHALNFPDTEIDLNSITEVDARNIPYADVIIGGFPCQDFSTLSRRKGIYAPRGRLYKEFLRVVEAKQPKAFVIENVKGILSVNNGEAITQILGDFTALGYTVTHKLYNFADYGVPQLRERVIIVGLQGDRVFEHPEPTHAGRHITALEALQDVESVLANNEKGRVRQRTVELLKKIPEGRNYTSIPKDDPHYVKGMISHVYRRLHRDQPSRTIIAAGGGGTLGYHYSEPRALTNRERARLQSFPDDFVFIGSLTEVRRQIGNACPPMGIRSIAKKLLASLAFDNLGV